MSLVVAQAFPGVDDDEVPGIIDRAAAEHGFEAFEVVPARTPSVRAVVASTLASRSVGAVFLAGLPLLRAGATLSGLAEERRRAVATVRDIIEQSADAGAEAVMTTSGPQDPLLSHMDAVAALVDSLTELAAFAAERAPGVTVRLEPTDTNLQHRQLVGGTALAMDVVAGVRALGQRIDLNLDLSHILELGEEPAESFKLAASSCQHVHLANCAIAPGHPLRGDRHPPFGHPGTEVGAAELAGAVRALRGTGYFANGDLLLGLEVIPIAGDDPWETLRTAVAERDAALAAVVGPD